MRGPLEVSRLLLGLARRKLHIGAPEQTTQGSELDPCAWTGPPVPHFNGEVQAFTERLKADHLPPGHYEALWRATFESERSLLPGQEAYGRDHRRRFEELFNGVAFLVDQVGGSPTILEFGASEFSSMYSKLFPHARFHLADRPVAESHPGFTRARAIEVSGCADYFEVDLEEPDRVSAQLGHAGSRGFDVIVFTEVLEHLVANATEVLDAILGAVRPGGFLYLTTPNFFSVRNLARLRDGRNPEDQFPRRGANWDAHHHHREYSLPELLDVITAIDGELTGCYLSDCWDQPDPGDQHRGNIVLVVRRR